MRPSEKKTYAIGIVAEYNPFHNGHALHIARARQALEEGPHVPVVVVLSSSFVQRGEPAIADKWTRTSMALAGGADLVLELPFAYACNAAPEFARGAVDTLAATQFVTHLSFGMENPAFEIDAIFSILIQEPLSFKLNLKKNLASGQSYPKAIAEALEKELPGSGAFISAPNNSLALSYLLHVRRRRYTLVPLPIQRTGSAYHDEEAGPLASATAIRLTLKEHVALNDKAGWILEAIPAPSLALLWEEHANGRLCLGTEKLWTLLQGLLVRGVPEELRRCAGMDEGMENLFLKNYAQARSYEDFIGRCVCARYTRSRLQRQTIRLMAGLDRWTALALSRCSPPYIRVLGYTERGRTLLRTHGKQASVPIITRLGAVSGTAAKASAELEFRASKLRELLLPVPDLRYEERQKPRTGETPIKF